MTREIGISGLVFLLAVSVSILLPTRTVSSQPAASAPVPTFRSTFETTAPSAPFDLVMQVREFAPGAWARVHTHPAPTYITVLEGEITNIQIVDGQKIEPVTYRPGDTFVEPAWETHEVGNLGPVPARWLQTRLAPKDVPVVINLPVESFRPGAPTGTVPYTSTVEVNNISGPTDVYQTWVSEWLPGAGLPPHFHAGLELGLVTNGELTVTKNTVTVVSAAQSVVNSVGEIHAVTNAANEPAGLVTTHLIERGRPFAFPASNAP